MSKNSWPTRRFIDQDFVHWYDGHERPAELWADFPHSTILPESLSEFDGQELSNFGSTLKTTLDATNDPRNTYHNDKHSQRVLENTWEGYDALANLARIEIPLGFLQPLLIGAAGHDIGQPGTTFYKDADPDRIPPGITDKTATEWYATMRVRQQIAQAGGNPAQQFIGAYVPASSAYGAGEPQGKLLNLEKASNPQGIAGRMMRAVDVLPADGDYTTTAQEDTSVLYGEGMPSGKKPPQSLRDYVANRRGFLSGYVLPSLVRLDEAVGVELTEHLGWQNRVKRRLTQLDEIENGTNPVLTAILKSALTPYGVTLT